MLRISPVVLFLLAAPIARAGMPYKDPAQERPLNPDRWTTLELDASGMSPWKADQIVYAPGKPDADSARQSLDTAVSAFALFPLSDSFSLTLGFGGDWSETQNANAGANGSSISDNSLLTYRGAVRWYYENMEPDAPEPWHLNPDRWPSLGLNVTGAKLVNYSAGNAAGNGAAQADSNAQTGILDARWPVAEAWTLTAGGGVARTENETRADAIAPRVVTLTGSWVATAGVRFFFVERSLIVDDQRRNPDMWPMLSLTGTASRSFYTRQTLGAGLREVPSFSESGTLGARVPVTDHWSLNFSAQVQYARSYATPLGSAGAAVGTLTRTSTLVFTAGARYFIF